MSTPTPPPPHEYLGGVVSALAFETGQQVFRPRDTDRALLTVTAVRRTSDNRHRQIELDVHGTGRHPTEGPHHLVHADETLRPDADECAASSKLLVTSVNAHTEDCSYCGYAVKLGGFWATARRCLIGKSLLSELAGLSYYRNNVLPWLAGDPADPARLVSGQHVTARIDGRDLDGVVSKIDQHGRWHEPGEGGLVLLRHRDGTPPTRYAVPVVFHRP
ncbi:hypothetical protein [Streptomyces hydrogenans]|uniref:hypothetical protein n=1 Tax=Streptomyces hydrogenans TaxID=1873719 RepID=UPI003803BEFB